MLVVGIIAGAMMLSGGDETAIGATSNNWYGKEVGIVTFTEYVDFQCPGCGSFYPILSQVKELFKDQVRFEIKHFPLVQSHPSAITASRAAQAAANQGKFWEMHDLIFQRQQSWSQSTSPTGIFEGYANELGLDMDKYKTDAASSNTLAVINSDIALGKSKNVNATPTFFVDGQVVEDTATIASVQGMSGLLQQAINDKQGDSSSEAVPIEAEQQPIIEQAKPEEETN